MAERLKQWAVAKVPCMAGLMPRHAKPLLWVAALRCKGLQHGTLLALPGWVHLLHFMFDCASGWRPPWFNVHSAALPVLR